MASALPARAELYRGVAQGLSLLDFQFSGERNLLGDGITVNANAFYSQRKFDFGVADLTLSGPLSASAGFTRRGIPGANFSLSTSSQPLSYTFNINNGGQNLTASGSVLVDVNAHVNALGFYNETVQVSNTGTYTTTGLGGETTGPLAFDLGPINKSGNLFADLIASVTQPFFAANNLENPFAKLSDQSMKLNNAAKSVDELRAKAAAGETLSDQELSQLINNTVLMAVLGGEPSDNMFDGLVLQPESTETSKGLGGVLTTPTPEPTSLGVLVLLLATGFAGRRRAR
jgi:hypothetical protein